MVLQHVWYWLRWVLLGLVLIVGSGGVLFVTSRQFSLPSENNLPKFIQANVVDPRLVTRVSKFRSGAGHSNPGWPELCRSMKHYFYTYDPTKQFQQNFDRTQAPSDSFAIAIYSPVNGRLSKSGTGEGDDQVNISVDGEPGYSIRLEHVHLDAALHTLSTVTAGQKIATVWNGQSFDVSIFYSYIQGDVLYSYFEVLPDSLFAPWQAAGATTESDFILTKEYRDAHPLECLTDRANTPSFAKDYEHDQTMKNENFVFLNSEREQNSDKKISP